MNPFTISPAIGGAIVAVLLAMAGFGGCEHVRANAAAAGEHSMKLERDQVRGDRDKVLEANSTLQATIDSQGRALNEWAKVGVSPDDVKAMLAAVAARLRALDELVAANAKLKEKDDANPDCEKLRQVDFQRVCPNRAGVLRGYEGRGSQRTAEGSASAGVRGVAGGAAPDLQPEISVPAGHAAGRGN